MESINIFGNVVLINNQKQLYFNKIIEDYQINVSIVTKEGEARSPLMDYSYIKKSFESLSKKSIINYGFSIDPRKGKLNNYDTYEAMIFSEFESENIQFTKIIIMVMEDYSMIIKIRMTDELVTKMISENTKYFKIKANMSVPSWDVKINAFYSDFINKKLIGDYIYKWYDNMDKINDQIIIQHK